MSAHKYRARRATLDGIEFASTREMKRYSELKLMEKAGVITGLLLQPRFLLQPAFKDGDGKAVRAIHYVADFSHIDVKTERQVVTDVKGFRTEVYKLKRKLFLYKYPDLDFEEV